MYNTEHFLVAQTVNSPPAVQEMWVRSLGWEDLLEKELQPTPVLLSVKSHGQRSLVGDSPVGGKESDMTEQLTQFQMLCAAWMGWGFGGEWIHVYVWLSPFAVHLKLSQHCL